MDGVRSAVSGSVRWRQTPAAVEIASIFGLVPSRARCAHAGRRVYGLKLGEAAFEREQ